MSVIPPKEEKVEQEELKIEELEGGAKKKGKKGSKKASKKGSKKASKKASKKY